MYGAKAFLETGKIHAKNAIGEAENEPADQARSEQVARQPPKPENGKQSEEAKKSHCRDIARKREAVKEWNAIGGDHPPAEGDGEKNPNIDACAHRGVPKGVERPVNRQVCSNGRQERRSKNSAIQNPGLRRRFRDIHGDGRAGLAFITSTIDGSHGIPVAVAGLHRRITIRRCKQ